MAPARKLVLHGLLLIFLSFVGGGLFGAAIVEGWGERAMAAWKLVHLEGLLNGMLLMIVGATYPLIDPPARLERILRFSLVLMGYGNVLGACFAALTGQRGLAPTGPLTNILVLAVFSAAVLAALVWLVAYVRALRAHGAP